jgi:hypothetical protein
MKEYENTILLKDYDDEQVDGIIQTNEDINTIQKAIYTAKDIYYELEEKGNVPCGINCEYEYIVHYLQDKFECNIIEFWTKNNVVYY